jgi:hypothetical protein
MTQKLVDCGGIPMALPILNVGFAKAENTTLFTFCKCAFNGKGIVTHNYQGRGNQKAL